MLFQRCMAQRSAEKARNKQKSNPWLLIIKITTKQWDFMGLKLWNIYRPFHFVCHCKLVSIFHISLFASIRSHGNTLLFLLCKLIHLSIYWPFLGIFSLAEAMSVVKKKCKELDNECSQKITIEKPDLELMTAQLFCRIFKNIYINDDFPTLK